jgi:glycosyl hydrolase family 99
MHKRSFVILFCTLLIVSNSGFTASESNTSQVDVSTLTGKIMCGYQGWFTCPGDGADRGWTHYGKRGQFKPGQCTIDLWPDVSELDEDEKYTTSFKHDDGSDAHVFSSMNRKTVVRHFKWMRDYGIDGVFVQRFAVRTFNKRNLNHVNTVLRHCREGANKYGRAYAVMYDLSGLREGQMDNVINDWKNLVDQMGITKDKNDKSYLHHNGKPVVSIWGIGFNDKRKYTLKECARLIDFMKNDPKYGGCTVMIGVPTYWRTQTRDTVDDPYLHEVILKSDIISPWTIGRFGTLESVEKHSESCLKPDIAWCKKKNKEYLPVVFPGFSWHNMKPDAPFNAIPRQKGKFLWKQITEAKKSGATMIYQAMFDEVDEGTAIFKCTNNPPVGDSKFLTYEDMPSDYYLWLVGKGGQLIRGEIPLSNSIPRR